MKRNNKISGIDCSKACRCHEEREKCGKQKIEPPICHGHYEGPIACKEFRAITKTDKRDSFKKVNYKYRCRMCGYVFVYSDSGPGRGFNNLVNAIHKISVDNQTPIPMTVVHKCSGLDSEKYGIADLLGCDCY